MPGTANLGTVKMYVCRLSRAGYNPSLKRMVAASFATTKTFKEFHVICSSSTHTLKGTESAQPRQPRQSNLGRGGSGLPAPSAPTADRSDNAGSLATARQDKNGEKQCYECKGWGFLLIL